MHRRKELVIGQMVIFKDSQVSV